MKARLLGLPLLALTIASCAVPPPVKRGDRNNPGAGGSGGSGGGPDPMPAVVCGTSKIGKPSLRRLTAREYVRTLEQVFPEAAGQWTSVLIADSISKFGFDNDSSALVVGKQMAQSIADTAESVAAAVTGASFATILPCSATAPDRACATEFLNKYGRRLFRRSLTASEQTAYLGLFDQALATTDFPRAIAWMTRGLIQSPATVYRREVGTPDPADPKKYKLTPQEVATELAYTYAGTAPDDAVLAGAEAGQVNNPADRVAGANVLLMASGNVVLQRFFESWLGYSRVISVTKTAVPTFAGVREQMAEETRRFIQEVVVTRRGGSREFLLSPFTTPTAALASFYGFPAPASEYAVVNRPAGQGLGILAQGSVLASMASPDSSSPTKRGLLVMERFLCKERPIVPNGVPPLPSPDPGRVTTRQRHEESHAVGTCNGCHKSFDPIGFGFEHFDEVGRYRADEGGLTINATSFVPGEDAHLFEFTSAEELVQGLANQPLVHECVSGYIATYAFGGAEDCLGETRRPEFIGGTLGFADYYTSLAAEPHFGERVMP